MRIAVVATGAVGAYFGGRLALAGEDVSFLARGEHLRAMRERGLIVESVDGDFTIAPIHVTDDAATLGTVDVVLLAVKGWQAPDAIKTMRPLVGADTVIVPLLNGIDAPDQLVAAFGARHATGGLCRMFGSVEEPGRFRNTMPRTFISFGELDNRPSERLDRLREAFTRAGIEATIAEDIRAALWQKLMFVGPFGAVGAVTRAPIGVMRSLPQTRALLVDAMTEIGVVARANGVAVAESAVAATLALVDGSPAPSTSSMQRDIIAGRPSELDSQVGAVAHHARAAGVEAPIHAYLYASLLPLERQARGEIMFPR